MATGTAIGTFSSTDPDVSNTLTYSLVEGTGSTDNASFSIVGGELRTNTDLNFETKSSYSIRVRTTDQGGLSFEQAFTITVTNVNEQPTALALSNTIIAENVAVGTLIGMFQTTDTDAGNTFTYSLVAGTGSTDNASFAIVDGELRTNTALNFETKSTYTIRVRTTDQGGLTFEQTFTITITNVNESPTALTLSNTIIAENVATNIAIGTFSTTDPDASNLFTYTLVAGTGSTDNTSFTIVGGELRTNTALNFETKSSYSIRVRTTDQGGLFFEQTFTISVTNVNETPTALALSTTSIAENVVLGTAIGTFASTDSDASNTFTYTLVSGTGSTDNASFTIVGGELRTDAAVNFETRSSYSIRVRTTDQGGLTFEQTFTISVTNVNEQPTALTLSNTSIAENVATNTAIGTFTSTDPDASNTFAYSLVAGTGSTDNASFSIVGGELRTNTALNFETKSSYSIRVRTTDQGGLSFEQTFTITVTNVNEQPTALELSNAIIAENVAVGAPIGMFTTTDPDAGNTFTYSLVAGTGSTDNASFAIVDGELRTNTTLNFESRSSYSIRVRTTDQGGMTFEQTFSITVTNVNEQPTELSLSNTSVAENVATGTAVGVFSTIDPDASNTFAYNFVAGTGSTDNARFLIVGSELRTNTPLDFETKSSHSLRVRTTDQGGLSFEQTFTITVTNITEQLMVVESGGSTEVTEGGPTDTFAVTLSSPPPSTVVVSVTSGNTAQATVPFNQALLLFTAANWNVPQTVTITAVDDGIVDGAVNVPITVAVVDSGSDDAFDRAVDVTVTTLVLDRPNRTPTELAISNSGIAENSAIGTTVGAFSSTDPDAGNTFTYTPVAGTGSTDNGSFQIVGNELRTNAALNFEAQSSYSIRVRTTDQGGMFFEQTFTIAVTNVNEAPTAVTLLNRVSVLAENANTSSPIHVADISVTDDALGSEVITLSGADAAVFEVSGSTLQLRAGTVLNFEAKAFYSVTVNVDDGTVGSTPDTSTAFDISVTNVNEAPTALAISASSIAENVAAGSVIGAFTTTDPDAANTFTYSLVVGTGSADNASFLVSGDQLRAAAAFNFEAKASYAIRVRTTDQDGLSFERSFTITVTNVNEAPLLDNAGNVFTVLGVGQRQSTEMRRGTLVSDILARGANGNPISDPDENSLRGIAITAVDQSLGNFQYTLVTTNPAEGDWVNVDAAGPLLNSSALLLPTTARIRFTTGRIPHHASAAQFLALESKLDAGITFRAWDQTSGVAGGRGNASVNGGATAFSQATETSKVYFEARLFRHFNRTAQLNVYTLEAEFNALAAANNPAFEDRSNDSWTGFTVLLSNVPELATTPMYRLYYGVQFNVNRTEIDMGYRYLTTNLIEAQALENSGPADKRPQRAGAYFREQGVNSGTGILGYIYTTQQPGTQQMRQIYRTDIVQKPTRPTGTSEGGTPTSFTPQENGDHVYTTNTAFEMTKTGTWRVEDPRGFVRPLGGSGVIAPATADASRVPLGRGASTPVPSIAATSLMSAVVTEFVTPAVGELSTVAVWDEVGASPADWLSLGLIVAGSASSGHAPSLDNDGASVSEEPPSIGNAIGKAIAFSESSGHASGDGQALNFTDDLFSLFGNNPLELCLC